MVQKTKANDYLRLYCGIDMQFARENKEKMVEHRKREETGKFFACLYLLELANWH